MNIKVHTPMLLAVAAVIIASSGTAVAVSSTTTISDPLTPARKARVDAAGRLSTTGTSADINSLLVANPGSTSTGFTDLFVTSSTTAKIGVSRLASTAGPSNTATYTVTLFQVPVETDGSCNLTIALRSLSTDRLAPGAVVVDTYPAPLVVTPRGNAGYCLDVFVQVASGTASSSDYVRVQFTGATVSGTYAGTGTGVAKAGTKDPSGKTVVGG